MHTAEMERAPQGIQTHKIPVPASFTEGKAAVEPKRVRKLELETEEKLDIEQTSTSTTAHMHTAEMERTPQGRQTQGITTSFTDGKELEHLGKPQLHPEGKLDQEQTSTSTPAHIHAQKRKRTSQEKQTNGIPASFTEGKAPSKPKCARKLQLDHEGSLEEQTSTSTPACMHGRNNEITSQGSLTHAITEGEEQGKSKASSSSNGDTDGHHQKKKKKITDQEIIILAGRLPRRVCEEFCVALRFELTFCYNMLSQYNNECKPVYMRVLHEWMLKTGGLVEDLDKALDSCGVGGLKDEYKE